MDDVLKMLHAMCKEMREDPGQIDSERGWVIDGEAYSLEQVERMIGQLERLKPRLMK